MKNVLLALVLLTGLNSFAKGTGDVGSVGTLQEVSSKALKALIAANPIATSPDYPEGLSVAELLTSMTSSFDENGSGSLTVVKNTCEPIGRSAVFKCRLSMHNTDMKETRKGNYVRPEESLESSTLIEYTYSGSGDSLFGNVTFIRAG